MPEICRWKREGRGLLSPSTRRNEIPRIRGWQSKDLQKRNHMDWRLIDYQKRFSDNWKPTECKGESKEFQQTDHMD